MGKKNREDIDTGVGLRERMNYKLDEPHHYSIIMLNDDFTPMDFVVMVLVQVFLYDEAEANRLMLQVHHSDKAVVGIYTYDIAVSKARKATNWAREEGFPLRLSVEPEDE
jgi:ATP-dependent Clp protease adaptor protein ClpS